MKIIGLIKRLEKIIVKHGDLPVSLADWDQGYRPPCRSVANRCRVKKIKEWDVKKGKHKSILSVVLG